MAGLRTSTWCACAVLAGAGGGLAACGGNGTMTVPLDGSAQRAGAMEAGGETGAGDTAAPIADGGDSGVADSGAGGEASPGNGGCFDGSNAAGGTCGSANWDCFTGSVCFFPYNQPVCGSLADLPDGDVAQCCGNIFCADKCSCSDPAKSHCSCP